MDVQGKTVLILGGAGEVGLEVCRLILMEAPKRLIVASSRRETGEAASAKLRIRFPEMASEIHAAFGNIFVRADLKDTRKNEILSDAAYQELIIGDILSELSEEIISSSFLYQLFQQHRPDIVVDCINTATAFAYQDIYRSAHEVSDLLASSDDIGGVKDATRRLLLTLSIPQLLRHIQILHESMRRVGTSMYVKVGTTGTGGMGLNIPYTHGEEKPSRVLMSKSALAGAHSMLLFLMARTPDGPIVKEVKPAAVIGWKSIGCGPVLKAGVTIPLFDCQPEAGCQLNPGEVFEFAKLKKGVPLEGRNLESVYIDTGENGVFSLEEFKAITTIGQMEFLTPEEIAGAVLSEIKGGNTAKDIIDALDGAIMGPTYRAGFLRRLAIEQMESLQRSTAKEGIAFEILGPPRLSKLLFEIHLLHKEFHTMENLLNVDAKKISQTLLRRIETNQAERVEMISVGIPILLPDERTLLLSSQNSPEMGWERQNWAITPHSIDQWAEQAWVDLRPKNMDRWRDRFREIIRQDKEASGTTSSLFDRGQGFWKRTEGGELVIDPGEVAGWMLIYEEKGKRMKD